MGTGTYNAKIKTILTMEDIALISGMAYGYQQTCGDNPNNQEVKQHSIDLVNRLGGEMSRYPINDFTKDPEGRQMVDDNGLNLLKELRDVLDDRINGQGYRIENLRFMNELLEDVNVYIGRK